MLSESHVLEQTTLKVTHIEQENDDTSLFQVTKSHIVEHAPQFEEKTASEGQERSSIHTIPGT